MLPSTLPIADPPCFTGWPIRLPRSSNVLCTLPAAWFQFPLAWVLAPDELPNAQVSPAPQITMSEKNRTRLQALLDDRVTLKLLHLPWEWMNEAATNPRLTPMEAARLAMFATALEIMLVVPLRRHNVVHLRLDTNLRRQGPQAPDQ